MKISSFQDFNEDQTIELDQFITRIENEYKTIEYKFGATFCVSPHQLDEYNKQYLYKKLYKNDKLRKAIQVKTQTISPVTVKNFLDQRGRFINLSKNKVYNQIKGKNYILQLGNIPSSSRSRNQTFSVVESQHTCNTSIKFRTKRHSTPTAQSTRPSTCNEIYRVCQEEHQDQKKLRKMMKQLKKWNENQYEKNIKRPQSCIQQQTREIRNQIFMTQFTENIMKIKN